MTQRKKLIEVALPLEAINVASAREKSIRHGHPSTLHLWWARRPLAAARAVIFTSLVDDPDSDLAPKAFVDACKQLDGNQFNYENKYSAETDTPRMRLFDFIAHLVTWESTTDEKMLEKARELILLSTDGNPPPLLDPFAGGGSIPLEAQRLGLEAHASDLNPVAVMINKAQIEIPPRFADMPPVNPRDRQQLGGWKGASGLAADVRYYGEWMRDKAYEKIGHLYPKMNGETVIAWLWARTVESPNPAVNVHVPLMRSFQLSKKKGREYRVKPIIKGQEIRFEVVRGKSPKDQDGTMISRQGARCIISNEPISYDYIRNEGKQGKIGRILIAVVTEGKGGRNYYSSEDMQIVTANQADRMQYVKPKGEMPLKHRNFQAPVYGMYEYGDLFTSRQLVALTTFSDVLREVESRVREDVTVASFIEDNMELSLGGRGSRAYAQAIVFYLGMIISKVSNYWSSVCSWHSGRDTITSTFGRQAIPMVWDYAEANPFSSSSGNFLGQLEYSMKVLDTLSGSNNNNIAFQQDSTNLNSNTIMVSTDPPYYDSIEYADLSDYFYVWMRPNLRSLYPEIFSTLLVPKEPELVASASRYGSVDEANKHFEKGLFDTFENIRTFIDHKYPLTVYYAFKQSDADLQELVSSGWETVLNGIVNSGFSVLGTWP